MSLEEVILSILSLGLGDPYEFLAEALSPPSEAAIQNALRFLDSLDAVFLENRDEVGPKGGAKLVSHITPLGYHLAALPLNPRTGKLLLTSCLMGCINPMLTIAAATSVKNIFISPFEKREEADESKLNFMLGESDLLTLLNAYSAYRDASGDSRKQFNSKVDAFCRRNFLSYFNLQLVDQMRAQFLDLLKGIGFLPSNVNLHSVASCTENRNGDDLQIIKCVLCSGLAPNILRVPCQEPEKIVIKFGDGKKTIPLKDLGLSSRKTKFYVHPSSVMSMRTEARSRWIM